MRDIASTFRLSSLFRITAVAALCATMLFLSGCGCKCNKPKCNSCNKCNTCGVSDATPSGTYCPTCATSGGNYERVGSAPPTLSEQPQAVNVYSPPPGSNTNFDRVGQSQDLPVFSAPSAPVVTPVQQSTPVTPIAVPPPAPSPAPAQLLPPTQPRSAVGGGQYHTLSQGETVYGLSRKYGVPPKNIIAANHFSDPNRLAVGTKVYIPAN